MALKVRDEEDVIESVLRYHRAQGVDFFIVTDNASTDRTPEILGRWVEAGLAQVIDEPSPELRERGHEWVTRMARVAATEHGADWVVHGDADEFWWPLEGTIPEALASVPDAYGVVLGPEGRVRGAPRRPRHLLRPAGLPRGPLDSSAEDRASRPRGRDGAPPRPARRHRRAGRRGRLAAAAHPWTPGPAHREAGGRRGERGSPRLVSALAAADLPPTPALVRPVPRQGRGDAERPGLQRRRHARTPSRKPRGRSDRSSSTPSSPSTTPRPERRLGEGRLVRDERLRDFMPASATRSRAMPTLPQADAPDARMRSPPSSAELELDAMHVLSRTERMLMIRHDAGPRGGQEAAPQARPASRSEAGPRDAAATAAADGDRPAARPRPEQR